MFPAQLRGGEQHLLVPYDNLIVLVKSFDEFADFHFGEFCPLDQIDANFIDNLSADDRLGCFDERLGNIFSNYTTSGTPNNILGVTFWLPFLISCSFSARNVSPGKSAPCSL
jgi:hypothetical protein